MTTSKKSSKPVVQVILDGWGEWRETKGNALATAKLPTIQKLNNNYPKLMLQASGLAVGLPWGVCGNSEVGHQTMGTGQVIYQYLPIITQAIENNSFFKNEVLINSVDYCNKKNKKIHLVGLVSDGGVHSHISHLTALLEFFSEQKFSEVYIHAITDGRDTPQKSAQTHLEKMISKMKKLNVGKLATLSGRFYAMDRNNNWDRVEKAFLAMTAGEGIKEEDPFAALRNQYRKEVFDEYLEPVVIADRSGNPVSLIEDGDVVVCFNFRKDRARQITKAFAVPSFNDFKAKRPENIKMVCFTEYEKELPTEIVFPPQEITARLGELIAESGKKQLRVAETEKFAHVTYFFNGGVEKPFKGEDRELVPSKKVSSYADAPEMGAEEVTEKVIKALESEKYSFILVNYANPDMVGHTGNLKAAIKAVETVDDCLMKLVTAVLKKEGSVLITADHGNVEEMINLRTTEVDTEHSVNPVPCWLITPSNHGEMKYAGDGKTPIQGMLVDLSPTVLDLMGIKKPEGMIGDSLLGFFEEQSRSNKKK